MRSFTHPPLSERRTGHHPTHATQDSLGYAHTRLMSSSALQKAVMKSSGKPALLAGPEVLWHCYEGAETANTCCGRSI